MDFNIKGGISAYEVIESDEVVRKWEAPNTGIIRILGHVAKSIDSLIESGISIRIKKNDITIWPSCLDKGYIAKDNTDGFFYDIYTGISAGNIVCFTASNNENNGGSAVAWDLTIQYVEATIASSNLILPNDENIKYFGRWDKSNPSIYNSYWGGAYFKTCFTGTTAKLRLSTPFNIYVNIDDMGDKLFAGLDGDVNLTPVPLSSGVHTLKVSAAFQDDEIRLQGILLDQGAILQSTDTYSKIIEFIGDSITTGGSTIYGNKSSFAWLAAEQLNCEHTQISTSGVPLITGFGYCGGKGMIDWYFKQKQPAYDDSPEWDFDSYTADMVVINLGTNDTNDYNTETDSMFQAYYENFIKSILKKYPKAEVIAMRPFGAFREEPIRDAINSLISQGYSKLHYIDTTGWSFADIDTTDGIHPHDAASVKHANMLAKQLSPYLY